MSGPKLSAAELERLRQEQLERERQEALRKLTEARSRYNAVCAEVQGIKSNVISELDMINPVYRSHIEQNIKGLFREINGDSFLSSDPEEYNAAAQNIKNKIGLWKNELARVLGSVKDKARNDADFTKRNSDLQGMIINGLSSSGEITPVKIDFSCNYDEYQIKSIIQNIINHFELRISSQTEPRLLAFDKRAIQTIKKTANEALGLDDVKARVQQVINEEENQIRLLKEFDDLFEAYVALALLSGAEPKAKTEFSLDTLKTEFEILNDEYRRKDEMDYIANQINEVMIEQGYSFVSSRVLKKSNSGETEYSLYQEDGKAGVAVYTDDSGAVMMRMTVLSDGGEITDDDREFSYQSQIDFCSRHEDLVEALAERGVYLKQKSYQAPDKQHTYKVDVSDRSDGTSTQVKPAASKTQKVDRRARRRGGNKKMRSL